jgi:signal transduction histidine kinase
MLILAVSLVLFVSLYQKKVLQQKSDLQAAENKFQKDLLHATIQVEEAERDKIARNIHDDVGTSLNVIRLHLTKLSRNSGDKTLSENLVKESMGLLDESIENVRGIARDLMPPTLVKLGFEKGVTELFRKINSSGQIDVRHSFQFNEKRFNTQTELHLYRIMQEMLNNIIKHSQAKIINIDGAMDSGSGRISLWYEGNGLTKERVAELMKHGKGVGLKSMQSRAQLIGATIGYRMEKNQAVIEINIPLNHEPVV